MFRNVTIIPTQKVPLQRKNTKIHTNSQQHNYDNRINQQFIHNNTVELEKPTPKGNDT